MQIYIDAERFVTNLANVSRRVHGPEHNVTIDVDILLKKCKARYVQVDYKMFQALRYEMMEGEICVIQGPIAKPRQVDKERMYSVECNLIVPATGCAVICHGLRMRHIWMGSWEKCVLIKIQKRGID